MTLLGREASVVDLRCEAVRWVDDGFPGCLEVRFTDAEGRTWTLFEKWPIFGVPIDLGPGSVYPVEVTVGCVILEDAGSGEADGIVTVSTSPHGVATPDGREEFRVRRDQLIHQER
ncbi:hypothetical protein ACFRAR_32330 [Kitasatospora sp. NPDC056651]|uniref:hypothetical protein n=1 Tax=Kitasatospora sp. NPDC056651 TaxID=3345892 RepID=UPI00367DA412